MLPQANEIYRHFKGKEYKIITLAKDSETGEDVVVYQALYGDNQTYVRPLDMFLSPVDKEKYPDVTQEMRFQKVVEEVKHELSPITEKILDTDSIDEKLRLLDQLKPSITDWDINVIAITMDMEINSDLSIGEKYEQLREKFVRMSQFQASRFR
jgi:hypothetical protein